MRRDLNDKIVGGVCAGIGRRYNVDPVLLRVLFIVGTLAFLAGPLAYVAFWLLLPTTASTDNSPLTRSFWRLVFGVFFALGALSALLGWFGSLGGVMGVVVGGSIVALGYWLYSRPRSPLPAGVAEPAQSQGSAYQPGYPNGVPVGQPGGELAYTYPPLPAPTPARPREPRSYLGLITFLTSLIIGSAMVVASATGLVSIDVLVIMAVMLAVLAVGLIIGAFRGWSRLLIIPGVGLALLLGVGAQAATQVATYTDAGVGEQVWEPVGAGTYELGIGAADLNLAPWANDELLAQPVAGDSISASVGAGELRVFIPSNWNVAVTGEVGVGEIVVEGEATSDDIRGPVYRGDFTRPGAVGQIALDLNVDFGQITIQLVPAREAAGSVTSPPTAVPPVPVNPAVSKQFASTKPALPQNPSLTKELSNR